jgi:DNA-binding PadR family transcriptional regulator
MSPVFGHGRLRLYLLKLLDESPKHGYEIIQQLKERFAGLYAPSAGTVYPRLARMESEGLVRHVIDGGRKVYHITDAGRAELTRRSDELADLEAEIRASVNNLADEIRDEVKESAQHVRDELREAERQLRADQRERARQSSRAGRQGQDAWQAWSSGNGASWRDWREQWKQQWTRQWAEQWQEELARLRTNFAPPFGAPGAPSEHDEAEEHEHRERPDLTCFLHGHARDDERQGTRGRRQGGPLPGFDQLLGKFRSDLADTVRTAMSHAPISEQQIEAAGEVLERTTRELRRIFERD